MATIPSCDPATLVQQAKCYKCIPKQARDAVRAYLLCQSLNKATPPCITPQAPKPAAIPRGLGPTNSTITASWNQPANAGTLIIGYIVSWGTTAGGPYPNSSGLLPVFPKLYTITGLSSNTTYYYVIQAIGAVAGCNSANSTEANQTTTAGAGPCAAGTTFAAAWAANVVANGGPAPSAALQQIIATLQCGLIADGLDTKMVSWNLFSNESFIAALTPQRAATGGLTLWTTFNFVAGDLSINGFTGNGVNKVITPGINMFSGSAQSFSIFVYTAIAASTVNGRAAGDLNSAGGTPANLIGTHDNTANSFGVSGANPGNLITTPTHGAGFYCDSRVSATDHRLYYGSSGSPLAQIGATDATNFVGGFSDSGPYFFGLNQGGGIVLPSAETLSVCGTAVGLTLADVTNLFNRFQTALVSKGGGFV